MADPKIGDLVLVKDLKPTGNNMRHSRGIKSLTDDAKQAIGKIGEVKQYLANRASPYVVCVNGKLFRARRKDLEIVFTI